MESKLTKVVAIVAAPIITLTATDLVASHVPGMDGDAHKATGAALAALAVFVLTQTADALPKRFRWWRRRFDGRAAFEGWWIQKHPDVDRASVFSFLYSSATDTMAVDGNAFNGSGEHLAHWNSTQVFFSDNHVNYLWKGKSWDKVEGEDKPQWIQRSGTTTMWLNRTGTYRMPVTGGGEVLHLRQERVLDFQLRRITPQLLASLLPGAAAFDDLADLDVQRRVVQAYLAQ
jgi:hypothetical protein